MAQIFDFESGVMIDPGEPTQPFTAFEITDCTNRVDEYADERLCPTTGEFCVARNLIVDNYTGDDGLPAGVTREFNPANDGLRLRTKLAENAVMAELLDCQGMEEGICPVRETMNHSKIRTTSVSGFRAVRSVLRRKEK